MRRNVLGGLSRRRLRWGLWLFFLALVIPTTALIYHALSQLKWEAFHRNRVLAEELAQRIDGEYRRLIAREEARPFTDYAFLNIAGSSDSGFLQRSPLSQFPPDAMVPGLIGYFQVDAQGRLSTPLLPPDAAVMASYGIGADERIARLAKQEQIAQILTQNRLVDQRAAKLATLTEPASVKDKAEAANNQYDQELDADSAEAEIPAQAAFDRLAASASREPAASKHKSAALGQVYALEQKKNAFKQDERRGGRKEQTMLPAPALAAPERQSLSASAEIAGKAFEAKQRLRITTFESEIDPLEISLLGSGQFVLFRKVWRNGERQVQGLLIDQQAFVWDIVSPSFNTTALARMADLTLAYRGKSLGMLNGQSSRYSLSSGDDLRGELLYQTALSAPLGDLELIFNITQLPIGPGGRVLLWIAAVLALVLVGGFYFMYRLGMGQIRLARQQQDFVSAVSHELKTPLTSIRMYGEMLREGWVSEEKRSRYYDYIFDESERLSRLINNVLQLAKMTRSEMPINARELSLAECMDLIRGKVGVHIERAGFEAVFHDAAAKQDTLLRLDPDHLSQIMINLVDNAIKFSAKQALKRIEINCVVLRDKTILISVRDYGPGIPRDQMKKIFKLFYRSENELTRETVGTGIGLALVHQLTMLMGGRIDVINQEPGTEFQLIFPVADSRKLKYSR